MAKAKKDNRVHELKELEVREVSLVDRPANGRRFSMVKSESGAADMGEERTEIDIDGEGNLTTDAPPPGAPAATATTIAPVFKAIARIEEIFGDEAIAKRLSVPEELKGEAFKRMREVMRRIDTAMSTVSMSETADGDTAFTKLIGDELVETASIIAGLGKRFGGGKRAGAKKSESDPDDFTSALTQVEVALTAAVTDVEKRGAKMASGRLKSFESALSNLGKILSELRGQPFPPKSETKKALVLEGEVAELRKELGDMRGTIQKQAVELKQFRDARQPSAAIPVEKSETGTSASDTVSWPMDLNQDPSVAKIDKSVDFR